MQVLASKTLKYWPQAGLASILFCCFFLPLRAESDQKMIELILDASGSMRGSLPSGEIKWDAAERAVSSLLENLASETIIGFRAYGHQHPREEHDCEDTELLATFQTLEQNRDAITDHLQNLKAQGYTPITFVLERALGDFPNEFEGQRVLILVSDGKETCEGDPCARARALAKGEAKLVVHTVGFGVDQATEEQLNCIASVTGGHYFPAETADGLATVLENAIDAESFETLETGGVGWLQIQGANLEGHVVTDSETGEEAGRISRVNNTIELPAGIYNVTIGNSVWKSVEIRKDEKRVLEPGSITVQNPSVRGHPITEFETGTEQASVSHVSRWASLIPGVYNVWFGSLPWTVEVNAGEEVTLNPGTVTVRSAYIGGHDIYSGEGDVIGSVSSTQNWMPLPPGDYSIEIDDQIHTFSLEEGEGIEFQR